MRKFKKLFSRNSNVIELNVVIKQTKKKLLNKILDFFHKFVKIIDFNKIKKLLFRKSYDYKIEFIDDFSTLLKSRMYFLLSKKLKIMKKYLKNNLKKDFISFSQTLFVFFILFVVKSNEKFRFYVDYRKLNVITKRNAYFIFLINEILTRVIGCKYIFKLNIIVTFNKLRIIQNNEDFIIFITFMNIYKYHVIFFELINDSIS